MINAPHNMVLPRHTAFAVYYLAVFLFFLYLDFTNLLSEYYIWLSDDVQDLQVYDYIVVGAGSAGSVLAGKLADAKMKILLTEAGSTPPYFLNIPVLAPLLQQTPYDWQYITTPQQNACKGLIDNVSRWPMGKILGGSSRLNYMAYVRGHSNDYNDWLPDYTELIFKQGRFLNVESPQWQTKLSDAILKGAEEILLKIRNTSDQFDTGFAKVDLTMKDGARWSTDRVFEDTLKPTLTVMTNVRVNKVLFKSNKAVGVELARFGRQLRALARKGVILSAGVIGSPKILMLSGIGPRDHLASMKIDVITDLPVGQHLVDHVLTGLDLITLDTSMPLSIISVLNPISALEYFFFSRGPWTSPGIEAIGTFHTSLQNDNESAPDLQLMAMPVGISQDNGIALRKAMGISDKVFQEYFAPLAYKNAITIAPVLLHPKSEGDVKLRSSDPYDDPIIDAKYLSHKDDVSVLIEGIHLIKRLIKTKAMRELGASLYTNPFPGCEGQLFDSREYWECYVRHLTLTSYHPAGTCRVGSVVDNSFRVYNMKNLYVVDASVLPRLPSGNINAAVIMLAEKAALLFLESNRRKAKLLHVCSKLHIFIHERKYCSVEIKS